MASRYWVGGTATWNGIAGTKWAETSGGPSGFSVPTTADDVFFDAASSGVCTIDAGNTGAKSLDCTGFTGTITGSITPITVAGSVTLAAGMTWTHTSTVTISGAATLTTAGKPFSAVVVDAAGFTVQLGDALNLNTRSVTVTQGTFTTNNYSITAGVLGSNNTNTRTINLGSSTVSLSGLTAINFTQVSGLTFNAGTSQINFSAGNVTLIGGVTFYNVNYTVSGGITLLGANTFNNLVVAGRTSVGISAISVYNDQIVNGTLTLSVGISPAARTFVRSDTIGTIRTLTCAAVAALTDVDFRDITIAGAAAPVSGTRLGDGKGNSGVTFGATKTVYWRSATTDNWGSTVAVWAPTDGGTADVALFPLAQDTAVFETYPNTGVTVTVNAAYNIGAVDISARVSNALTIACSAAASVYGNWVNGTGLVLSGTGSFTFAGRTTQTLTSAGRTFTQGITISSPGGVVQLADAFISSRSSFVALVLTNGTFAANNYSVTLSGANSGVDCSGTAARTMSMGSGTWTIAGANGWIADAAGLSLSGTAVISLTSASNKTFAGGGVQTYPTLNQGGTGTLTVSGSNKFASLTNTAIGRIQFTGGTTNELTTFNVNGVLGNLLPVGSTTTTQATLKKPSAWGVGANSTDSGNNTGLSFTGTSPDYLNVSYINGIDTSPGSVLVTVSGEEATSAVGEVQVSVRQSVVATGVQAQAQLGSLAVILNIGVSVTGAQAQASVGNPSVVLGVSVTLTGVQAQAQLGSLTATLGAGVPVTGVQAQSQLGTLSAGASNARVSISGVYVVGSVGTTLVWGLVNDTQPADWHNINDTQDPGWAPVSSAQLPSWAPIADSQIPEWSAVTAAPPTEWAPVD